jgi:hypothetical protein
MRVAWCMAVLGCGLLAAGQARGFTLEAREPPGSEAAQALPELARVEEPGAPVLVVRGTLPAARAARLVRLVRAAVQDARRRFLPPAPAGLAPVDVCLLADTPAYRAFLDAVLGPGHGENDLGLFSPYRRVVAANLDMPPGYLRHEVVHALVSDALGPLPAWLDEGLASLYNEARLSKGILGLGRTYRLDQLRAARAAKTLPDLAELARSTGRSVYGGRSRAFYSLGRFLLLYLDSRGELRAFLTAFRVAPATEAGQREVLGRFVDWPAFLAWVDGLP